MAETSSIAAAVVTVATKGGNNKHVKEV